MDNTSTLFTKARKAGAPLVAINCFDPESAIKNCIGGEQYKKVPVIKWDVIKGWQSKNSPGTNAIATATATLGDVGDVTMNEVEQAELALKLPPKTVLFLVNGHMFLDNKAFIQALWNLRDKFKINQRTLVIVGQNIKLPPELENDFVFIEERLPDDDKLGQIVDSIVRSADITVPSVIRSKAIDALRGMSEFPAETAVAMNISKQGIDINGLWNYKKRKINDTPGLTVYEGKESFADIGGCAAVKEFLLNTAHGKEPPKAVVFIDEGEKMFAGATNEVGDNTGVSQDMLATMLSYMEDNNADGSIFVGPPGAAKSAIAKSFGNEVGIPTISLDLGSIKGSLVGESERNLRNALKIIDAISGGNVYFILTCNKDVTLPPELKRRFTSGTFFFDLPVGTEASVIWDIYLKKFDLTPPDNSYENWTGAEIRNCCRLAYRQNISVDDAAQYIVPVAISARRQIEDLRKAANGRYLSANKKGIYALERMDDNEEHRMVTE